MSRVIIDNMTIEITTAIGCVNRCGYCPQQVLLNAYKVGSTSLSFDDFTKIENHLPQGTKIHFSGFCEPSQNRYYVDMMRYTKMTGHPIGLFTALTYVNPGDLQTIGRLLRPWPLSIHLTDKFKNNGVFKLYVDMMLSWGTNFDFYVIKKLDSEIIEIAESTGKNIHYESEKSRAGNLGFEDQYIRGKIRCRDNRQYQNVVLPNGDVQLCCMDYGLKHTIGNIFNQTLREIHESDVFKNTIALMDEEDSEIICRKCYRAESVK